MKALFAILSLVVLTSAPAIAAKDSLGVFFRPEKTVIMIAQGGIQSRLQKWLKYLGAKQDAQILSDDGSFKMDCVRDLDTARCQFRVLPSALVQFNGKKISAHIPLKSLGLADSGPIEIPFESANGDRLDLVVSDGILHFYASKSH